jgi:protein-tyrosine phosphatase
MANWVKSLFSKPPEKGNFSSLKTDLHSHLIPGIDDGVQTMEEAILHITTLKEMGFTKLITTPHIMPGYYDNTREIIMGGLEKVRAELKARNIDIEIEAAAEYYFDDYLFELLEKDELLTFSDNYLLFELPSFSLPNRVKEFIFEANSKKVKPMLAHVERYAYLHDDQIGHDHLAPYQELYDMEVFMQLNIGSLAGIYSEKIQKLSYKLIEKGLIDFLGSDLHGDRHIGYLDKALNDKHVMKLLKEKTFKNTTL